MSLKAWMSAIPAALALWGVIGLFLWVILR